MIPKRRYVPYETSLLTYVDIRGFRELIDKKTANDIARSIRVVKEAVEPDRFRSSLPALPREQFINFSDLNIIWTPLHRKNKWPATGWVHSQIVRVVHAQSILLFDEGILLRGGITIGNVARSYGQLFGPAVVRAYDIESKIARFPRIVVGGEVLDALNTDSSLWVHDQETDVQAVKALLRRDCDGEFFVDYLRVIEEELDDRSKYPSYLDQHQEFIAFNLAQYSGNPSILQKYKWLQEYHDSTASAWKKRQKRPK